MSCLRSLADYSLKKADNCNPKMSKMDTELSTFVHIQCIRPPGFDSEILSSTDKILNFANLSVFKQLASMIKVSEIFKVGLAYGEITASPEEAGEIINSIMKRCAGWLPTARGSGVISRS